MRAGAHNLSREEERARGHNLLADGQELVGSGVL